MNLRYVDLGYVSPEIYVSMWEYDCLFEPKLPTLVKWSSNTTIIDIWQGPYWEWDENHKDGGVWKDKYSDISDYIEGLPELTFTRPHQKLEITYDTDMSYYVTGKGVSNWILLTPNSPKEDREGRRKINEVCYNLVMDILKEFRVETEWAMMKTTNDMFAKHMDGTWKKFFGGAYKYTDWEYGYQDMSITYDFDYKTAEKVRNFDGKIRVKKFDIDDIRDVVGGLCEINPNFNRVEFEEKIVDRICDKFDYIRKDDILSEDDEIKLLENGTKRNTEKDWLYYGRNKGFAKWSKY